MKYSRASALFLSFSSFSAVYAHHGRSLDAHSHQSRAVLPDSWAHDTDHPIHALFRRDIPNDGATYPDVGSATWSAAYPEGTPDSSKMPQAWKDALNAAVQAGKIPDIPPTTVPAGQNPVYANNLDPMSPQVCSSTYKCRISTDVWDAPDGVVGISFDDGPLPPSDGLFDFLKQNDVHATHFFIGVNILDNWRQFLRAIYDIEDDIAVHTWTHPYMTSLSNEDVVAQLAWTMQIIHDSTGGRVPRFWRPPYGDSDTRVSAIAKEVLGMTTVIWNQDSEDWSMETGGTTLQKIHDQMTGWYGGAKTPGLVILEHELTNDTVKAFIDGFWMAKSNNWQIESIARMDGTNHPYQNADGPVGAVTGSSVVAADNVQNNNAASGSSAAPSSSASANASSTPSSTASSSSKSASSSSKPSTSSATTNSTSNSTTGSSDQTHVSPAAATGPSIALAFSTILFSLVLTAW
ncbi:carbohydrate esterase family 4 protein [Heterobasidion irregulare TC 32-1]|uniref:chitin deacetylase n=1 Tax=Heterobasidion irregulare (strain TC 32-1) TaxID=747525 RepID=W4KDZ0_HETIT|nr:carbohydrate esterase family 4 protein [Heterobasidion irregulare TC 32-1]ETW84072.1 carbohydrate esterase family 4 protein [Heterobasidion irregulare TC 32-1]